MLHGSKGITVIQLHSEPASKYHTWYTPLRWQSGLSKFWLTQEKGSRMWFKVRAIPEDTKARTHL